jgi:WD40 repeat protein
LEFSIGTQAGPSWSQRSSQSFSLLENLEFWRLLCNFLNQVRIEESVKWIFKLDLYFLGFELTTNKMHLYIFALFCLVSVSSSQLIGYTDFLSKNNSIVQINVDTAAIIKESKPALRHYYSTSTIDPSTQTYFLLNYEHVIERWNYDNFKPEGETHLHRVNCIDIQFDTKENKLYAVSYFVAHNAVTQIDIATGNQTEIVSLKQYLGITAKTFAFDSKSGKYYVGVNSFDKDKRKYLHLQVDVKTRKIEKVFDFGFHLQQVSFSSTGNKLAGVHENKVYVLDVESGKIKEIAKLPAGDVKSTTLNEQKQHLYVVIFHFGEARFVVVDLQNNKIVLNKSHTNHFVEIHYANK